MHFHKSKLHQRVKISPRRGKIDGKPLEIKEKNDNNFIIQRLLAILRTLTMKISWKWHFYKLFIDFHFFDLYVRHEQSQDRSKILKITNF